MALRLSMAVLLAAMQISCATQEAAVVFVTKTSLGIDVESTPPGASIAYDRVEGYIGPRFDDGTVPPVAGSFVTNGKLFDREVKQVYATGNAAKNVTSTREIEATITPENYGGNHKVMFFGTSTVLGLKLAFLNGMPESFTLGYKRKELSVIPFRAVPSGAIGFPSVLATLDTNIHATTQSTAGLDIGQYFATGVAAQQLSREPVIRDAFIQRARDAIAQYREDERQQSAAVLATLRCFAKVDDAALPKIWLNAEKVALFDDPEVYPYLRTASVRESRVRYTEEVSILNPKSQKQTGVMMGHRTYVCELANP